MAYTIENINGCTKKILFAFDEIDLSGEIGKAIKNKQRDVSLKGFRKGKAPLSMVEQMYRPQIESEALNQFVQKEFFDVIEKEDLRVVGHPSFEDVDYSLGKSIKFNARVEIFPSVEVKDFSGLSFSKEMVEVSDRELEDVKKNYLESRAEMKEIEDQSKVLDKGCFAVVNFQGEMPNGDRPENMKGDEFLLEIGSGQFIPGFEEGMVGMKKGAKKVLELTFPENYHVEDLKNALIKFDVELVEIKEKIFPEFTDELAKEFNFESVQDFQEKTMNNLRHQKEREVTEKLNQKIIEKLVEENPFDVPMAMVAQQEKSLKENLVRTLQSQGFDDHKTDEYFQKWAGDVTGKALFQVKSGLILDSLAKSYEIEATEEDFEKKIEDTAKASGLDVEQVRSYYNGNKQMRSNLMYGIREEKTFEKILDMTKNK